MVVDCKKSMKKVFKSIKSPFFGISWGGFIATRPFSPGFVLDFSLGIHVNENFDSSAEYPVFRLKETKHNLFVCSKVLNNGFQKILKVRFCKSSRKHKLW